ncbi:hypothetical protein ACWGII_10040 [Streptomyces sp. NPDC054855]
MPKAPPGSWPDSRTAAAELARSGGAVPQGELVGRRHGGDRTARGDEEATAHDIRAVDTLRERLDGVEALSAKP